MRAVRCFAFAILALALAAGGNVYRADDEEGDEVIEHVMKRAFKGDNSLVKKAASGDISKAEKTKLLDLMVALSKSRPPHGPADSWKEKTDALVDAAQDLVDGKQGAADRLSAASACKACHRVHKGKDDD